MFLGSGSHRCLLLFYTIIIHRGLPIVVFIPVETGSFIFVRDNKTPISRCGQIMGLLIIDVERSLEVSNVVYGCKNHPYIMEQGESKLLLPLDLFLHGYSLLIQVVHGELRKHKGISAKSDYHHSVLWLVCFLAACPKKMTQVPNHTK